MQEIQNLTGVGVAGLAVVLMYKLISNHFEHHTKAINELREMIGLLTNFLRNGK